VTYQPLKRKTKLPPRVGGADLLRPVNVPQPTRVSADADGQPLRIQQGRDGVRVVAIVDHWRIDDRWWSEQPVSRHYWECELASGQVVTVYQDEITRDWYEQRYTPPREPELPPVRVPE
jgi:hypothetical protein